MAVKESPTSNPLVATGKNPDTSLNVQLHPLVLLTISDYITRHTLRQQKGPVIGAVIGQQNGRDITLEQAFQCKLAEDGDDLTLDGEWFLERLSMFKEVHKEPALDLVALFMLSPAAGPQAEHLPVLKQVQELTSLDSTMLLLFHPEQVDGLQGGKLPISLYEPTEESDGDAVQPRFRELAFEVETGDAEMIGVDFVAKGAANATAIAKADAADAADGAAGASKAGEKKGKGKGKAKDKESEDSTAGAPSVLSPEDEELISSLNAKVNAIKMLDQRLGLIRSYLVGLNRSYLTDSTSREVPGEATNFALLRSMSSLLSRLPLLAPPMPSPPADGTTPSSPTLQQAGEREKQDVHLTALLASLTRTIAEAQDMGAKLGIVQREKSSKDRSARPMGRMGHSGGDDGLLHESAGF